MGDDARKARKLKRDWWHINLKKKDRHEGGLSGMFDSPAPKIRR
jgi:hypothetical protein